MYPHTRKQISMRPELARWVEHGGDFMMTCNPVAQMAADFEERGTPLVPTTELPTEQSQCSERKSHAELHREQSVSGRASDSPVEAKQDGHVGADFGSKAGEPGASETLREVLTMDRVTWLLDRLRLNRFRRWNFPTEDEFELALAELARHLEIK